MSLETIREEVEELLLRDDFDLLRLGQKLNFELKRNDSVVNLVHSRVVKVGNGFSIDDKLRIKVASYKLLTKLGMKPEEFIDVYKGAILHENGHAILFPFMTRYNTILSIVYKYLKERGVPFEEKLFHSVENAISDAYNELILYRFKRVWHEYIPALCDKYVIRPQRDKLAEILKNRPSIEAYPSQALILVHNMVFSLLYNGKLKAPRVPRPKWLSEHVYNQLYKTSKNFPLMEHIEIVNTGHFSKWISTLLRDGLFENIDRFYNELYTVIGEYEGKVTDNELKNRIIGYLSYDNESLAPYWVYFTLLASYYRFIVELRPPAIRIRLSLDTGEGRPQAPGDDILEGIFHIILRAGEHGPSLLPPALAEYASKQLLSSVLAVTGREIAYETESTTIKIPWYRRPRGKIDPYSMLKPSILDWRVQVKHTRYTGRKIEVARSVKLPTHITIVVDESSSTHSYTSILSRVVGADTAVYDVERVTLMSLLYNVMRYNTSIPTTLVRFSDEIKVEQGTIKAIYNKLKSMTDEQVLGGFTDIEGAVATALQHHVDGPSNYFLLATDMEIDYTQAENIAEALKRLRKSPILILAIAGSIPSVLEELNKRKNAAVVSVKSPEDYSKMEAAIKKLAKVIEA